MYRIGPTHFIALAPGWTSDVGQGQSQEKWRAEGGHWADDEGQWWTADGEKFLLRFSTAVKLQEHSVVNLGHN